MCLSRPTDLTSFGRVDCCSLFQFNEFEQALKHLQPTEPARSILQLLAVRWIRAYFRQQIQSFLTILDEAASYQLQGRFDGGIPRHSDRFSLPVS
jgi:hypothetical protein